MSDKVENLGHGGKNYDDYDRYERVNQNHFSGISEKINLMRIL